MLSSILIDDSVMIDANGRLVEKATPKLPTPSGYKLLVRMYKLPEKTSGGLYRPEDAKALHDTASICAQVVAMGPDAYQHPEKFPNAPWCSVGDWVVFRTYSGTRMKIGAEEYRLINDDTVEAVVDDPASIDRA